MSIRDCIQQKGVRGLIRQADASAAIDYLDGIVRDQAGGRGEALGEAEAGQRLAALSRRRAEEYRRQAALQIVADKNNLDRVTSHGKGVKNGALALVDRDIYGAHNRLPSVASVHQAVLGRVHGVLFDAIERFRLKGFQFKADRDGQKAWLKAIMDGDAGQGAAAAEGMRFAQMWKTAIQDVLEPRYRKAGGILPEDDARIYMPNPQHDPRAIRATSKNDWVKFTWDRLDRDRMVDFETGERLNDGELSLLLDEVYDTLATDGLNKLTGQPRRKRMVGRRMQSHRVLHFRDADAWLSYNDRFGGRDVYAALLNHVDLVARDIALMEVMGPNADAAAARFADLIRQEAKRGLMGARHFERTYENVAGIQRIEGRGDLALWGSNIRAWLTAQQLGSAMLTATSDFGFMAHTALWNGISPVRVMKEYIGQLGPGGTANRRQAARLGMVVENALGAAHAQYRFVDAAGASRLAGDHADWIMRASGLAPHTQAGRSAMGMATLSELGDRVKQPFERLPKRLARALEGYGIDADAWDIVRRADIDAGYVSPVAVAQLGGRRAEAAAAALSRMLHGENDRAVPAASARVNALLELGTDRGTGVGEGVRFLTMYKRFPVLIVHNHLARLFGDEMGSWRTRDGLFRRGAYMASLIAFTTVMGGFALQLNEIANGRDPRDMESEEFWLAAAMKGGALGFFADFLYSTGQNSYGRSPLSSVAGPGWGLASDTAELTLGNAGAALRGDNANLGRDAVNYFDRYLLPGTSLWYAKLGLERLVTDQLHRLADPKAAQRERRLIRRRARDFDQDYYWRPGRAAPDRAPDPSAAMGG